MIDENEHGGAVVFIGCIGARKKREDYENECGVAVEQERREK